MPLYSPNAFHQVNPELFPRKEEKRKKKRKEKKLILANFITALDGISLLDIIARE